MTVPDFQRIMLPLLQYLSDTKEHPRKEVIEYISAHFKLTSEDRKELLPSGRQKKINNRVGWARTYMKKAGLLEYPKRGFMKISERGLKLLSEKPPWINIKTLENYPEFIEFRDVKKEKVEDVNQQATTSFTETPEEAFEYNYQRLNKALAQEVLDSIMACSPDFFEKLVVDLVVKMGYGGSRKDAGEKLGRTGDEGVDGIIKEDKLGLDCIYLQAKRWSGTVGRPEIQKFAGALQGKQANKGIFITTSYFSNDAKGYADSINTKIVLIDGAYLAQLMMEHNVGVSTTETYKLKQIDSDYFSDE